MTKPTKTQGAEEASKEEAAQMVRRAATKLVVLHLMPSCKFARKRELRKNALQELGCVTGQWAQFRPSSL